MKTFVAKTFNRKNFGFLLIGFCLVGASAAIGAAQERDPFSRPVVRLRVKRKPATAAASDPAKKAGPSVVVAPPIQARIDNYKIVRQRCAELGVQCPKPTSVLTIDEMNVTGVFRTPRGYAAMVQAVPIKLSYTIYPGEKFYDGQLVAIEEGKLTFRRVTQMSDGKEIVAAVNKGLQQPTINGMAQERTENQGANQAANQAAPVANPTVAVPNGKISAEAVPQTETSEAAKPLAAPNARFSQLPAQGSSANNEIRLNSDETPAKQTAPAVKKPKKAANKR